MHKGFFKNYKDYSHLYSPWVIGMQYIQSHYFKKTEQYSFTLGNTNEDARLESFRLAEELRSVCNDILATNNVKKTLTNVLPGHGSPWLIKYNAGGYVRDHIHSHYTSCYAAVLSLTHIEEPIFYIDIEGERKWFNDVPGTVHLFRGDLFNHGTIPTSVERKIIVIDYIFEDLDG